MLFESGGILPLVFALADEICAAASGRARRGVEGAPGGRRVYKQTNEEIWKIYTNCYKTFASSSYVPTTRSSSKSKTLDAAIAHHSDIASARVFLDHVSL